MSSEIFESKAEDFRNICQDVRRRLDEIRTRAQGEIRKKLLRDVERSLENAQSLIRQMESEARLAPMPYRSQMNSEVRQHKTSVEILQQELRTLNSNSAFNITPSFSADSTDAIEQSQRDRLMAGTASLQRASESLARSQRVAIESEQIGEQVIGELGTQRESLTRTRDRLVETEENLSKSHKIIRTMARRVMTNKLILIVIIVLEIAILGGVVYWKFFS